MTPQQRGMHPAAVFGWTVAVSLVLAVVPAAGISKLLWGYWFFRPRPDSRVLNASAVLSVTPVTITEDVDGSREFVSWGRYTGPGWYELEKAAYPAEFGYYLLDRRVLRALERRGTITGLLPGKSDEELKGLLDVVRSSGVLAREWAGYDQFNPDRSRGTVYELRGDRGEPLLLVAFSGSEISNDHHPYYELLFERGDGGGLRLVGSRRFFFDVAGMEGFEFPQIFIVFGAVFLGFSLPLVGLVMFLERWSKGSALRRGLCPRCRYDLRGDHGGGCPECGWGREDGGSSSVAS